MIGAKVDRLEACGTQPGDRLVLHCEAAVICRDSDAHELSCLRIRCRSAVGDDDSAAARDAAGGDRGVTIEHAWERRCLVVPRDHPYDSPRAVDRGIG